MHLSNVAFIFNHSFDPFQSCMCNNHTATTIIRINFSYNERAPLGNNFSECQKRTFNKNCSWCLNSINITEILWTVQWGMFPREIKALWRCHILLSHFYGTAESLQENTRKTDKAKADKKKIYAYIFKNTYEHYRSMFWNTKHET